MKNPKPLVSPVEGHYYKMRNGETVGPMTWDGRGYRAHNGNTFVTWHSNGSIAKGTINPGDLVSLVRI